ncbi:AAA family ATPase [Parasedimentitalea psychrophila]|uniref:AAA family ATPase n=2 Tax=Parasedimentitalea psychrophila TaxID=2997337 RepID=A0A9Y2L3N4_9RHOB|nr:AAA family ATPase [Parasedimentitalea psychrophila]WIY27370.1 AAA family ATPase [Parasedimentitalea psychrophila]
MGKTACLKLIDALFKKRWSVFSSTEFEHIVFNFSDGSEIVIRKFPEDETSSSVELMGIAVETNTSSNETGTWTPRSIDTTTSKFSRVERFLPFLTRSGPRNWTHDYSGQTLNLQDVVENYAADIPEEILEEFSETPPEDLLTIIKNVDCHLIETQRLLVFRDDDYRRGPHGRSSQLAISKKAQVLRNTISKELASYAAISQSLDRSFPRRVIQTGPATSPQNLAASLAGLDATRRGLMEAGILDPEGDEAFPIINDVNDAVSAVLKVYVSDTEQKLNVLERLRERILLFIELIDDRFTPKSVVVHKNEGFRVQRSTKHDVPLEKLSSGEQHQLVLFFELLFELKPNALILIDEPELSLHVGWQKKFIPDLQRIIALNEFDVLLATHSPQLIGEWDDVVVDLGDVE